MMKDHENVYSKSFRLEMKFLYDIATSSDTTKIQDFMKWETQIILEFYFIKYVVVSTSSFSKYIGCNKNSYLFGIFTKTLKVNM